MSQSKLAQLGISHIRIPPLPSSLDEAWTYSVYLAILICLYWLINFIWAVISQYFTNRRYTKKIQEVRQKRDKRMEDFMSKHTIDLTSARSRKILNSNAHELCQMLRDGVVTSQELVITFANQIYAKRDLNLYADCNFERALQVAESKDEMSRDFAVEDLPPLHGLPMSFKDQFAVEGYLDTAGYACQLFDPNNQRKFNSPCVQVYLDAGVVPLVKSNIPVGLFIMESCNHIWGDARNPWNEARSPGGSSGGEGGLVASHGSPLGLGSDIGGSIRIPAAFNGTYGFKPSSCRVSHMAIKNGDGSDYLRLRQVMSSIGPLGRSVSDLKLALEAQFGHVYKYDPVAANMPFNQDLYKETIQKGATKRLKIAYLLEDSWAGCAASIKNTVQEVVEFLRSEGHEVEMFPMTELYPNLTVPNSHLTIQPSQSYLGSLCKGTILGVLYRGLNQEYLHKSYRTFQTTDMLPKWLWYFIRKVLWAIGQRRLWQITENMATKTFAEWENCNRQREKDKHDFQRMWRANGYDALVMPMGVCPATIRGRTAEMQTLQTTGYLANSFDLPAGIVPIRLVKESEQSHKPKFRDALETKLAHHVTGSKGLPTAVQVVGLTQQDEKVLAVMKVIEERFDFFKKYNQV